MSKYIDRWSTRENSIFIHTMYRASIVHCYLVFVMKIVFKAIATLDTSVVVKYEK